MIPNENPFIEFLTSLTTEQPDNESAYQKYLAIDPPPSHMLTRSEEDIESFNKTNSKVYIWYKRDGKINLETFLKKLTNELEYKKHPVNKDVCLSILVYFALDPEKNKKVSVTVLNSFILSIVVFLPTFLKLLEKVSRYVVINFRVFPYCHQYFPGEYQTGQAGLIANFLLEQFSWDKPDDAHLASCRYCHQE